MGMFNYKTPKLKPLKVKPLRVSKMRTARKGERTLTKSDKKKEIEKVKRKCQKCKKVFPIHRLVIHHKRGVANYKSKGLDVPAIEFYTKRKKKAHYDRSKNLLVLCRNCHADAHKEESDKRKAKKKRTKRKKPIFGL